MNGLSLEFFWAYDNCGQLNYNSIPVCVCVEMCVATVDVATEKQSSLC